VGLAPIARDGRIGTTAPGVLPDLSRGGARLTVRRMLYAGTLAVLEIPGADAPFRRVVEIRHVGYEQGVGTQLGLMFRTDEKAAALLGRYIENMSAEQGAA